jgi:hypothetical protein
LRVRMSEERSDAEVTLKTTFRNSSLKIDPRTGHNSNDSLKCSTVEGVGNVKLLKCLPIWSTCKSRVKVSGANECSSLV